MMVMTPHFSSFMIVTRDGVSVTELRRFLEDTCITSRPRQSGQMLEKVGDWRVDLATLQHSSAGRWRLEISFINAVDTVDVSNQFCG